MRRAAEQLRDSGTNLLFLGANTAYWRIRWEDNGTTVVSYKDAQLDPVQGPTTTDLWRRNPGADPEAALLGSQYVCASPSRVTAPLVVKDPTFWGFKGLGTIFGSQYPGLVGHEIDRLAPESPANTAVVASSPLTCTNMAGRSDITYYTAPSGAGVVNLGSFGFNWAVSPWMGSAPARSQEFARGLVTNLVREAARGPLGVRYPSSPHRDLGHHRDPGAWPLRAGQRLAVQQPDLPAQRRGDLGGQPAGEGGGVDRPGRPQVAHRVQHPGHREGRLP